jgi:hypothetical protein
VVDEIKKVVRLYGANHISVLSELLIYDREWVSEFCKLLITDKVDIVWEACGKPGYLAKDILPLMKESGCVMLTMGFETGSDKILKSMRKETTVANAVDSINAVRKNGIGISGGLIVGDPEETPETIRETVDFVKNNNLYAMWVGYVTPYPGSKIYRDCVKSGLIEDEILFHRNLPNPTVLKCNMTKMTDEELIQNRNDAISEIFKHLKGITRRCVIDKRIISSETSSLTMKCYNCGRQFTSIITESSFRCQDVSCPYCRYFYIPDYRDVPHIEKKFNIFVNKVRKVENDLYVTPMGEHTVMVVEELRKHGIMPSGVLDGNIDRAGLMCADLPSFYRSDFLKKKDRDFTVLIVSELDLSGVISESIPNDINSITLFKKGD